MTFVTGGTGVLGAHLLLELLRNGKQVRALCRSNSNKQIVKHVFSYYEEEADLLFNEIVWVEGDILDYDTLLEATSDAEEIYHAAAIVSFEPSKAKEMKFLNRQGTANMVNVSLENRVKKFCHVSSVAALGDSKDGELVNEESERSIQEYHSAYSESKYISEMEVWRGIAEGLNAVIVNPSIILAPGDWGRSSTKLFPSVWDGFKFYTTGTAGYVDVRDVVHIMLILMNREHLGERYLLNAESLKYHYVFSLIAKELEKPIPNVKVGKAFLSIVQVLLRIKTLFIGGEALITKDTVESAFSLSNYSNEKVKKALNYQFIPVEQSVKDVAKLFLKDVVQSKNIKMN